MHFVFIQLLTNFRTNPRRKGRLRNWKRGGGRSLYLQRNTGYSRGTSQNRRDKVFSVNFGSTAPFVGTGGPV